MTEGIERILQDEDGLLKWKMARAMYVKYCEGKGFEPWAMPYVPVWAMDYADVALKVLDEDDVSSPGTSSGSGR